MRGTDLNPSPGKPGTAVHQAASSSASEYCPRQARLLHFSRCSRAACAAPKFSGLPVQVGGDGLHARCRVARDFKGGRPDGDGFGVDGTLVAQFPGLLDDGPGHELGLGRQVEGVGSGVEQLAQLSPEVGDVRRNPLRGHDRAAPLLELGNGGAPDALGVVGGLGDGGQSADSVGPQQVPGIDAHLDVADLGAEDEVAGVGYVRVAGQTGEQDNAVRLGQRGRAEHRAAARRPQDYLHPVHAGQFPVGGNCVLAAALGVLDYEFQPAPVDAARRVDFIRGHLLGLVGDGAVSLSRPRKGFHHADPEWGVFPSGCAAPAGHDRQPQDQGQAEGKEMLPGR